MAVAEAKANGIRRFRTRRGLKYCATVQFWGGQSTILRVFVETWQACFYTTL